MVFFVSYYTSSYPKLEAQAISPSAKKNIILPLHDQLISLPYFCQDVVIQRAIALGSFIVSERDCYFSAFDSNILKLESLIDRIKNSDLKKFWLRSPWTSFKWRL